MDLKNATIIPREPLTDIQLLEVRKILSIPVLRAFLAQQMWEEFQNRFAQTLDPEKPLSFVQSEAYYKRGVELFEWLLNYPELVKVTTSSGTN